MARALLRDRFLQAALLLLGAAVAIALSPLSGPARDELLRRDVPLLLSAVAAVGFLRDPPAERRERRLWQAIGLSWLLWVPAVLLGGIGLRLAATLVGALSYLVNAVGLEASPDRDADPGLDTVEWALAWPATLIFTLGLLAYFVWLPNPARPTTDLATSAELVAQIFEVYLSIRLLQLVLRTRSPRWRVLYGLLGISSLGYAAVGSLHPLAALAGLELAHPLIDLAWLLPLAPLLLAARGRLYLGEAPLARADSDRLAGIREQLLLVTLLLPATHAAAYALGIAAPALRAPRDVLVALWLVVLGTATIALHRHLGRRTHLAAIAAARAETTAREREEKLRLELAARAADERYQRVFDTSPDSITLNTSPEGRFVQVNAAFERMSGFTAAEVLGRTRLELGILSPAELAEAAAAVDEEGLLHNFRCSIRRKDGSRAVGLVSSARVEIDGAPHLLLVTRDVTELQRLQEQLLRAQRMESIGTLAGGVAHDLNNVLTPLLMALQILRRADGEEKERLVALLESNTRRGADLVRQVLAFARGVGGRKVHVQPRHLLRELEGVVRQTFPKSIDFELQLDPALPVVFADPTQVYQLLLNLCINARDAMPDGGRLAVRAAAVQIDEQAAQAHPAAKPGEHLRLEVADDGPGIDDAIRERIFDPFFTTKPAGAGTGLGLFTVRSIVDAHGGFLALDSAPGRGTRFRVHLPAASTAANESQPRADELAQGHGELVLVVDDEATIREVASSVLQACGYRTLTARDGVEAVATFRAHAPEIAAVLLDLAMPRLGGREAAEAIRELAPAVPILFLSGSTSASEPEASGQLLLRKPAPAAELLAALAGLLAARRAADPVERELGAGI